MENAIKTFNLTKTFNGLTAVDSLNLRIRSGEIFGFLGPNGAGKSTTIRMLTTLLPPTEGTAKILGFDVEGEPDKVRESTGVVPQRHSLFEDLTAQENLQLMGELYDMDGGEIAERSEELLRLVGLWSRRDSLVGEFSGGMKQRLSLATSILHGPKIIFMDEPTAGLDPQTTVALRGLTRRLNREGITVVYCTHKMEEAERMCDRVGIMSRGRLEAVDTPESLKERVGGTGKIEIRVRKVTDRLLQGLERVDWIKRVSREGNLLEISMEDGRSVSEILERVIPHAEVEGFNKKEVTLEDVFVRLTGGELQDE